MTAKLLMRRVAKTALVVCGALSSVVALATLHLQHRDVADMAYNLLMQIAALGSGAIALALTWRADREDSQLLATVLSFFAFVIGVTHVFSTTAPGWYGRLTHNVVYSGAVSALLVSSIGFVVAAAGRFSTYFPHPVSRGVFAEIERLSMVGGSLGALGRIANWPIFKTQPSLSWISDRNEKLEGALRFFRGPLVWLLGIVPMLVGALFVMMPRLLDGSLVFVLLMLYACTMILVGTVYPITFLLIGYAAADLDNRRRASWFMQGFVSVYWIITIATAVEMIRDAIFPTTYLSPAYELLGLPIALLAFLTCVGIATFYQGAFDPRLIVRRNALIGLFSSIAIGFYGVVENFLTNVITNRLGVSSGVTAVIAVAIVAIILKPLAEMVKKSLSRGPRPLMEEVLSDEKLDSTGRKVR